MTHELLSIMDELPEEIINEILMKVDLIDRLSPSTVCLMGYKLMVKTVKIIDTMDDFITTCRRGDLLSIVKSKFNKKWLNFGLSNACRGGHTTLVELMVSKGVNDWNDGLWGACQGGHFDLVELMISKGANDWNYGMWSACRGGHTTLVELLIAKGANDWNYGLWGACRGGHIDIVELLIDKGATRCNCGKSIIEHNHT